MKLHALVGLFLSSSLATICSAILSGEITTTTTTSNSSGDNNNNKDSLDNNKQQAAPLGLKDRIQANKNLTVASGNAETNAPAPTTKLDSNSTFYYEADAFLLNDRAETANNQLNTVPPASAAANNTNNKERARGLVGGAAGHQAISGRNGRMLDLDELVGDLEASRGNKERRAQLTSRQSRNLNVPAGANQMHHLDIGGSKRLHIQGFIPIVGIKDDQTDELLPAVDKGHTMNGEQLSDQLQSSASATRPLHQQPRLKMLPNQNQLSSIVESGNLELPYGQSSIGHASFNVQRYLNTDNHQQSPTMADNGLGSQFQSQSQYQAGGAFQPAKYTATGIVETLKKPIQKLTNTFGGSNNNDQHQHQKYVQLQQQQQQQQNCLCVPFYMCKNGYISESGLGRSQIQQMIVQQQQLSTNNNLQQPRQLLGDTNQMTTRPGSVESAPLGSGGTRGSFANSFVPVDERSSERELITAPPASNPDTTSMMIMNNLEEAGKQNANQPSLSDLSRPSEQSLATNGADLGQKANNDQQSPPVDSSAGVESSSSPSSTNSSTPTGANSPPLDEMTTLNQSNDYSQDILGRMLGLGSNSRISMLGSASQTSSANQQQQQSSSGVCGLLRTCCNIPISLFPTQQQQQQEDTQQQVALHRYQQLTPFQAPMQQNQLARAQISSPTASNQLGYELTSNSLQPASLYHRTSSDYSQQRPPANSMLANNMMGMPSTSLQQYARAPPSKQTFQSFQAPIVSQMQSYSNAQQQQQLMKPTIVTSNNNINHHQIHHHSNAITSVRNPVQLGTRKLLDGRCGLRQSAGINGRVQNLANSENSADFGEYPAQAAILKRLNGSESLFVCSGTLISQSWVATAAHCIRKHLGQGQLRVRLGEWDVHRDDEFYPYVEKDVRDLIIHPEFVPGNLINDIALVRLDSPIDPTLPHVNPACLPTLDESFARQRCWVAGWGKDAFGSQGSFQSVLQEVELPVLGHAECELALRQTRLGPHYRLHPGFTCAGGEPGKDACEGDGGSGLYCSQEGVIKVAGLVSWGISCGQRNVPGVFVSMPHYRAWIENIISIDDDIYSPYNPLPANTLISERSMQGNNGTGSNTSQETGSGGGSAEPTGLIDQSGREFNETTTTTKTTTRANS